MTKHNRKSIQTDIEDLILIAENDKAFEIAIDSETMKKKPERISLKDLSIKLRDTEFCKKLFSK